MSLQRRVVEQHFLVMSRKWKIKRKRPSSQHPSRTCIHWPEDLPIGSTTTPKFPSWLFLFQITVYKTDNYKGIRRKRESGQMMCVRRPEVEPWPTTQLWDLGLHPLINVNILIFLSHVTEPLLKFPFPQSEDAIPWNCIRQHRHHLHHQLLQQCSSSNNSNYNSNNNNITFHCYPFSIFIKKAPRLIMQWLNH